MANEDNIYSEQVLKAREELYTIVGVAMSDWSFIETMLYTMIESIVKPENIAALSAVYYSFYSLKNKLDMINSVMNISYGDKKDILNEWESLFDKLNKTSKRRNNLAHYMQAVIEDERNGKITVALTSDFLNSKMQFANTALLPKNIKLHDAREQLKSIQNVQRQLSDFVNRRIYNH